MAGLRLPTENIEQMCTTLYFYSDMSEHQFCILTFHDGELVPQRVKNVLHPVICYLQRIISHTLFVWGETASIFNFEDMTYVCSMLYRNNGKMGYMPYPGYHLAKHIKNVAHNRQTGGIVRIERIITKIARYLQIPTRDDIVLGYTLVDIARLERIMDEPLERQQPPPLSPPVVPEQIHTDDVQSQGGPTNQQIWDFMQIIQASITTMSDNMNNMRIHVDSRFDTIEQRMDEVEAKSAVAHHYAREEVTRNNHDYEDDPPTPLYQRRAATRRERELARQREEARLAVENQAAAAAQAQEQEDEDDEEEEDGANDMDVE